MAHGAMAATDPLTDCLLDMLGTADCAAEGAIAPVPYAAGLHDAGNDPNSDPWLRWVLPVGVVAGLLLSALAGLWPAGGL